MEKITTLTSTDLVASNIETLKNLFPTIVKEGKIDLKELQSLLGENIEETDEFYRFTWAGKNQARIEANKPSTATLRPNQADSKNWDTTQNVFIEGDNLEVLKLLQKSYANKIKMIYIDPPYNTGKDFVYKDNYKDNLGNYLTLTGQTDDEGKKLSTNTETDGRYHSNWLNMMYPRLRLARNLMTDDGVIFISIDDNEVHNLRKLCDEVFGEENFVGKLVIQTATDNNATQINIEHEYMFCFAKSRKNQKYWFGKNFAAENISDKYNLLKNQYGQDIVKIQDELRSWIKKNKDILPKVVHYDNVDEKGVYHDGDIANTRLGGYEYDIVHPITGNICKIPEKGFRYPKTTLQKMIEENNILFGKDENTLIKPKKRIEDTKDMLRSLIYEDGRASTKIVENLVGRGVFENPKSHFIISRILGFTADKNDTILDFFAGSGTTAHAIMQLNSEDGGNRKCISVQLPEPTDEKSEAFKANYKTIAEITKERIRRAGKLIYDKQKLKIDELKQKNSLLQEDKDQIVNLQTALDNLDIGFKAFKLDSSNIVAWDGNPDNLEASLDLFENNIKSDRTEQDILFEILLKYGLDLTVTIEEKTIANKIVYSVGAGTIFICLANGITPSVSEGIGVWKAALNPTRCRVIFKDTGFENDKNKTNAMQILKRFGIEEVNSI